MMSTKEDETWQDWSSPDRERQIKEFISKDKICSFFPLAYDLLSFNANSDDDSNSRSRRLTQLLVWICRYNAVKCFEALIEGIVTVDLNVPLEDGFFPLHLAAQSFSFNLTIFFLRSGARTNVRCNCVGHKFHGLLPLNVALESLSRKVDWTPKESTFKLIIMFCLLKMYKPLYTMKWLIRHMEPKEVQDVICHYAEKGNLIELAALLTVVAQATHPDRFTYDFVVESSGRREKLSSRIAINIASLINEEHKLVGSKSIDLANNCKEKQKKLISVGLLLEIYKRIGSDIGDCVTFSHSTYSLKGVEFVARMGTTIAYKIKKAGFPLTDEHLQLFKPSDCQIRLDEIQEKHLAKHCGYNLKKKDPAFPLFLQLEELQKAKKTTRRPLQQQRRSISTHSWHGKSFSMAQSFHFQPFKTGASSEVCTNMEAQRKKTFQVMKRNVLDLLLNKKVPTFSIVIRRAIGRV